MRKLDFLGVFNSPFKRPKLSFYLGKVAIGTPYFYPRTWKANPDKPGSQIAVSKKIGFDLVGLGWKTKWQDTDYRYEWSPLLSFVFFGLQFVVGLKVDNPDNYWTCWLYYSRNTDVKLSRVERVKQSVEGFPQTFTVYSGDTKRLVNYWEKILRGKYIKYASKERERDSKLEELGI